MFDYRVALTDNTDQILYAIGVIPYLILMIFVGLISGPIGVKLFGRKSNNNNNNNNNSRNK